ncbi:hypothetical protein PHLGIDRAFT_71863 [Phlebiopsis gigantea 11061_1 CR5-6]|uniref:Uncharacterized protein n=1 Tax=Phlebiopsis gigantea (strain 11061_1 CR5-6) TaxID=745531 RepID=A0A0C3RY64_PHLG1|nr:hypothetical protein PHLGIDRAFT_71863 [Phlebiopsis gigantea 11061_1 CR5-6]
MCDVSRDTVPFPSTAKSPPTPLFSQITGGPKFVGIGIGVQNYTCASAGTFSSTGAVAELFDISCLSEVTYEVLTDLTFAAWKDAPSSITVQKVIDELDIFHPAFVLGQHYFIVNPITGSGLSPKWDFTSASEAYHPDAFVVGAKTGDVPAPTAPQTNVDWLSLSATQGELAQQVFRVETRGGQPPSSCTPGSADISVKYTSTYCKHYLSIVLKKVSSQPHPQGSSAALSSRLRDFMNADPRSCLHSISVSALASRCRA